MVLARSRHCARLLIVVVMDGWCCYDLVKLSWGEVGCRVEKSGRPALYVWWGFVSGLLWAVNAKIPLVPWVLREKCGLVRVVIGCCD